MNWAEATFPLFGQQVKWIDLIGNIFALATVWLAMRRTIWTWPVQLAGSVLLLVASVQAHITGNALKQVMFGALALYGWYRWTRGVRDAGHDLAVRPGTVRERLTLVGVMVVATALVALFFEATGWSWAPLPDAYIFVGSAIATYAQSKALIDFWWIWIAVDVVGVPLTFRSGLYVSGVVYGIFFVMVLLGIREWRRQYVRRLEVCAA
ncbi:nicotinamide riboside transporter PnuC [Sphaerisporangium fuscum]|uniref:nicotinamide riboside transporter PnuC n=1 Tax=Sphaerisporangium fuscum TaxID=2835868 RepID=UPI001BDDB561|nr:nicotinamide riboside transporter PnuC [Sphaerisporangium fuscum]